MISRILPEVPHRSAIWATWAYLTLVDESDQEIDRLAHSTSASIREAVARLISHTQDGRPTELSRHLAADSVRQVRLATISKIRADTEKATPEMVAFLEEIERLTDPAFVCYHCGTQNSELRDSCESCHIITERPSKEAARVIELLTKVSQP
jgi:hypothetical protein